MKLKSLSQSRGECDVKAILEDRLATTPYQVWGKVRLSSAIGREPNEHLPEDLFSYLTRAELDYLIIHRTPPNRPLLAVEFDGPHHDYDVDARRRDILKNRLCRMGGLPLLRVRYDEIKPLFARDSFLSYLVEVILRYKRVHEKKEYAPPSDPDEFTEREYDEIRRHDLPNIWWLENELAKKHAILRSERATEAAPLARFAFEFRLGASDYASVETDAIHEGHLVLRQVERTLPVEKWSVMHKISKTLSLRTHYRTTPEPRPPWPKNSFDLLALQAYVKWLETEPWYIPALPGINWLYVAWNILEGLCLSQLLADAGAGKLQPYDRGGVLGVV